MTALPLSGLKILSLFPFTTSVPGGALTRFTQFLRFLVMQGATVTAAITEDHRPVELSGLTFQYFSGDGIFKGPTVPAIIRRLKEKPQFSSLSPTELKFLLSFETSVWEMLPGYDEWLRPLADKADIITVDYPLTLSYLRESLQLRNKPILTTCIDALFELHGKDPFAREALKAAEVRSLKCADSVVFLCEEDAKVFRECGIGGVIAPLSGDAQAVQDPFEPLPAAALSRFSTAEPYFFFVGSLHEPNNEAALLIRKLAAQVPSSRFIVAGGCHPAHREGNFQALGQVSSNDLDLLYRGATGVLVPLLSGRGMSAKFYEACAYGKAVIATPVGARGSAAKAGRDYLQCPDINALHEAVRSVVNDSALRQSLGEAARQFALENDFRRAMAPYCAEILRIVGRTPMLQTCSHKSERRLTIVDNNLKGAGGHHLTYTTTVAEQARAVGAEVRVVAHKEFRGAIDGVLCLPHFSTSYHETAPDNPFPDEWSLTHFYDLLRSNHLFLDELLQAVKNFAPDEVVFLPNANFRQVLAVAKFLHGLPVGLGPQFVLLFRYPMSMVGSDQTGRQKLFPDQRTQALTQQSFAVLETVAHRSTIRIVTDSELLRREYAQFTTLPIEVLPIPHGSRIPDEPTLRRPERLVIGFLGDARAEKGFMLLLPLIRTMLASPLRERVQFRIQGYISSHYHQAMAEVIDAIKCLPREQIEIVEKPLDDDAYTRFLHSLDIVVIPYDALVYSHRTSGPFVESLCALKPVVVPHESWMSHELGNSRAGVAFASGDFDSLARAVAMVVQDYPAFKEQAEQFGREYREFHSPAHFIDRLFRIEPTVSPSDLAMPARAAS